MFGRGTAQIEDGAKPPGVTRQKRSGVEPQTGKDLGTKDPVRARRKIDETSVPQNEPEYLVGLERDYDVFRHAGSLVIFELGAEVGVA